MDSEKEHSIRTNYMLIDSGVSRVVVNERIHKAIKEENNSVTINDIKKITDKNLKIWDAMDKFKELIN